MASNLIIELNIVKQKIAYSGSSHHLLIHVFKSGITKLTRTFFAVLASHHHQQLPATETPAVHEEAPAPAPAPSSQDQVDSSGSYNRQLSSESTAETADEIAESQSSVKNEANFDYYSTATQQVVSRFFSGEVGF